MNERARHRGLGKSVSQDTARTAAPMMAAIRMPQVEECTVGVAGEVEDRGLTTTTDPLLQPFRIKTLQLRNRIVSTSHASMLDDGGVPLERYQLYHEEKARGGLAMTMMGGSAMT